MRGRIGRAWAATQETPLELALGLVALLVASTRLTSQPGIGNSMSIFAIAVWLTLGVGGLAVIIGRLGHSLSVESVGLALMVGGYWFSSLRSIGRAETASQVLLAITSYLAIAIGLLIRLYVVRRAAKARAQLSE